MTFTAVLCYCSECHKTHC